MTDVAEFLLTLRDRGIRCWADGDKLKCDGPPGAIDTTTREALRLRKQEILTYLRTAGLFGARPDGLVPVNRKGDKPPLFFLSGDRDNVYCVAGLASHLDRDQPVYFVPPAEFDDARPTWAIDALARHEVDVLLRYRNPGPFMLAGHCAGGYVAFEAARLLRQAGHAVNLVTLIDCIFPTRLWPQASKMSRVSRHSRAVSTGSWSDRMRYVDSYIRSKLRHCLGLTGEMHQPPEASSDKKLLVETMRVAIRQYSPGAYDGEVDVFYSASDRYDARRWRHACRGLRPHEFKESVHELRTGPVVSLLGAALQARLDEASRGGADRPRVGAAVSSRA